LKLLALGLAFFTATAFADASPQTVYDLLKLASPTTDGVRLGEGNPSAAAVVGGFNTGFRIREDGSLTANGNEAELIVELAGKEAYRLSADVTPEAPGALSLFVGGSFVGRAALSGARQKVTFDIPGEAVVAGDNYLTFSWRGGRKVRGRLLRGKRILQKPTVEPRRGIFHRIEIQRLAAAAARSLSAFVHVPVGGEISGVISGQGDAKVSIELPGEASSELPLQRDAEGKVSATLAAFAGKLARLTLLAAGEASWKEARVIAPGREAVPPAAKAKNVILWVIDTLRADKLGCYNPQSRVRTPNFDAFARRGVLFRKAIAQSSHSKPASASLLTGHYPGSHGASDFKDKLRTDIPLLSELFQRAGHLTAAFASNGFIGKPHGFVRGWGAFRNLLREGKPGKIPYLFPHVARWITAHREKPFFLYVHSVDPHVPYNPPKHFLSLYYEGRYRGPLVPRKSGVQLDDARAGRFRVGPADRLFAEALYDGEVTVADHYFGRLLDLLESSGLAKDTLVVVTADHGEEFWEHGNPGHGHTLYNELTRVPLLIGPSPLVPAARVVEGDVEMVDVAPTVLGLAGLPIPGEMQGRTLSGAILAEEPVPSPAFAVHEGRIAAAQVGRWKYQIYRGGAERVFDLARDPSEMRDLAAEQPLVRRYLRGLLAEWLANQARWRKSRDGIIGQPR
jgi:arylsulfatase A-like enzyme